MYFFLKQKVLLLRLTCLCKVQLHSILHQNLHNLFPIKLEIGVIALTLTRYLDFGNRDLLEHLREKQCFSAAVLHFAGQS